MRSTLASGRQRRRISRLSPSESTLVASWRTVATRPGDIDDTVAGDSRELRGPWRNAGVANACRDADQEGPGPRRQARAYWGRVHGRRLLFPTSAGGERD